MPRRTDLRHVLVIGSGPIVIGQACEFDYSGTQACRVLRAEGLQVSLVNSNPATIMTDPEFADHTYVEPITPAFVERVIAQQAERGNKIDALLATLGGQTALNTAVALYENGALDRYGVELIGADFEAIQRGEDRQRFKDIVAKVGGESARSRVCFTMDEVRETVEELGLPVVVRPSFTMGGLGSGMAHSADGGRTDGRRRVDRLAQRQRADRGIHLRLEGVRARADARRPRQRGRGVFDRERRPDGRAHRRLGDRRPCDDTDRPRIPEDARPRASRSCARSASTPAAATSNSRSTHKTAGSSSSR